MNKFFIVAILSTGLMAWSQSPSDDPNMNIGLNNGNQTEASVNDITKAHQAASAYYGKGDNANCPNCATPGAIHVTVEDGSVVVSGEGSVKTSTGEDSRGQQ